MAILTWDPPMTILAWDHPWQYQPGTIHGNISNGAHHGNISLGPPMAILAWDSPWKSTAFISAWIDLSLSLVLAGLLTFLSIVNWLRVIGRNWFRATIMTMKKKRKKVQVFCVVFCNIMLSCKMQSVLFATEQQETNNSAWNWHRQWTTTDLIQCHPSWSGTCQSWYVLTTDFTPWRLRQGLN